MPSGGAAGADEELQQRWAGRMGKRLCVCLQEYRPAPYQSTPSCIFGTP